MFVKQFPPKTLWSIDVFLLKVHIVSNFSKKALAAKIFSFLAHTLLIQNLEKRGQKLPSYYKVIFWESDENQTLVRNATNDAILHVKLLQRMVKIPKWKVTQLHRNCNLSLRETMLYVGDWLFLKVEYMKCRSSKLKPLSPCNFYLSTLLIWRRKWQ